MRAGLAFFLAVAFAGCSPSGPKTTNTSSDSLPSLEQRIEFLERYITFRRGYVDLSFHVLYQNNSGGMVPGPSDWDIRIVATVPPAELPQWVPAGVSATPTADTQWLTGVPGAERVAGLKEWYSATGLLVGIDRERSLVAYRRWKH